MLLTTGDNVKSGMKIQIIGTVIDIIGDAHAVYLHEGGSKDLSEFLGRAGVSIGKAGATAAIGALVAAITMAGVTAVTATAVLPAAGVIVVVVGGYVVAATFVDWADEKLNLKNRIAEWTR